MRPDLAVIMGAAWKIDGTEISVDGIDCERPLFTF